MTDLIKMTRDGLNNVFDCQRNFLCLKSHTQHDDEKLAIAISEFSLALELPELLTRIERLKKKYPNTYFIITENRFNINPETASTVTIASYDSIEKIMEDWIID